MAPCTALCPKAGNSLRFPSLAAQNILLVRPQHPLRSAEQSCCKPAPCPAQRYNESLLLLPLSTNKMLGPGGKKKKNMYIYIYFSSSFEATSVPAQYPTPVIAPCRADSQPHRRLLLAQPGPPAQGHRPRDSPLARPDCARAAATPVVTAHSFGEQGQQRGHRWSPAGAPCEPRHGERAEAKAPASSSRRVLLPSFPFWRGR